MTQATEPLRALFCIGITQGFHDLPAAQAKEVMAVFIEAFRDLRGRFGITVLGTFDDDQLTVGAASGGWPWTAYILADLPDLKAAVAICDIFRSTRALDGQLWKFARIEARIGRQLFAGNE
ncbi:hypothetical protein KRZ98_16280 [Sphingobium sp. AS12]|uniref:hypothetical protein n=1 Tax=Sphingobium sp. AS12 TaxID=2849495 RepID=UPI001C318F56|nr:hypothetical protein [Sphingobium sp. AS12]MBV2149805.1 hypothetical protein [Sphingobium sp. AS12]